MDINKKRIIHEEKLSNIGFISVKCLINMNIPLNTIKNIIGCPTTMIDAVNEGKFIQQNGLSEMQLYAIIRLKNNLHYSVEDLAHIFNKQINVIKSIHAIPKYNFDEKTSEKIKKMIKHKNFHGAKKEAYFFCN